MTGSPEEYPYLEDLITRYTSRLPRFLDREAVEQAGREGFLNAKTRFDDSRGAKFSTYIYRRVLGAMKDEVRRQTHYRGDRGHPHVWVLSLDQRIPAPLETKDPTDEICDRLTLRAATEKLPPRQRFLVLGLANDISQVDLARYLRITQGGVTLMKNRAFTRMRSEMAA